MPEPFLFGAATSSHQVEGGNHNDWTEWEKKNAERLASSVRNGLPDFILDGYPSPLRRENYISGRACDHYHRFREDFDIARSLGHNAHRFSIEWSRIEPEEGAFDEEEIAHYREVIRALRERGMEPFVTLLHYTLPVWLAEKGGVCCDGFPEYFARYAGKMAEVFKGEVVFWTTVNEPEVFVGFAYWVASRPPGKRDLFLLWKSSSQIIRAHRAAYRKVKEVAPDAMVGVAVNITWFESAGGVVDDLIAWLAAKFWNCYFLDRMHGALNFVGVNHYSHNRVDLGFNKNKNDECSDVGWELYPEAIYHALVSLKDRRLPIYITENGAADARDVHRGSFIANSLSWVRKAINEGVDVRGYFHWSLLDNFEWDSGFWPRFGLVEVDYKTLERRVRPSALVYKKSIETW